jgi:hypothetical protein
MKILKKILLVIGIIIAIPLLAALFIGKNYRVSRSATINRPAAEVFQYIKLQKNQDYYNKWVMADPAMKKDYRGNDGSIGFVYAWDSKKMGKGEQEIKSMTEGKEITTELRFEKPMESVGHATMTTEPVSESQTRVEWTMKGRTGYPFNLMNLFIDGMLGKDMESSLAHLKNRLEKK